MSDRRRKAAFASAVVVLLGITGFSMLREPGAPSRHNARRQQAAGPAAIQTGPSRALEPRETDEPRQATPTFSPVTETAASPAPATRGEGEPKHAPAVASREAHAATSAARAFLDGYLSYSYGRADAKRIRAAALSLLRELVASPPRVPATVARARPRLISVRSEAAIDDLGVDVLAVVDDGQRRYGVPLSVREAGGRWVVSAVDG